MKKIAVVFIPCLVLLTTNSLGAQGFSSELKEKIAVYKTERETIRNELVAKVQRNINATREEKSQAVKEWRQQNALRVAKQRKLAKEIHQQLRESIREKYESIKNLPEEESNQIMQEWYAENSIFLSLIGQAKSMEIAKSEFRQEARVRAQQRINENKKEKITKEKSNNGNNGNNSNNGNNGNNGKGKGKGNGQ